MLKHFQNKSMGIEAKSTPKRRCFWVLIATSLAVAGCQTTTYPYAIGLEPRAPILSEYKSKKEFIARLAVHLIPRKCLVGIKGTADKPLVNKFNIARIRENANLDFSDWYQLTLSTLFTLGEGDDARDKYVFGNAYLKTSVPHKVFCGDSVFNLEAPENEVMQWVPGEIILDEQEIFELVMGK